MVKLIIIEYVKKEIKNDLAKEQIKGFNNDDITENQRDLLLLVGLHAALYGRKQVQPGAKTWKITLTDAFKFMILHCKTENALDLEIEKRRKQVQDHKATLQPLIAVFGNSLETVNDKFCIIFENIKYYTTNLYDALVKLLKIFEVFDLAFPGPSYNVYQLLNIIVLGLKLDSANSKILSLVSSINNQFES